MADIHKIAPDLWSLAVPIGSLRPDPKNARKHGERDIEAVRRSLEAFGQRKPIVALESGVVIAGNGTLEAARRAGWSHVAVSRFEDEKAARAFALADNRTAELSEWDDDALALALEAERGGEFESALGWTTKEADVARDAGGEIEEDDVPELPKDPISKLGDVWILGGHKLLCGSCEDLGKLVEPASAKILVTDPPYGVSYADKNRYLNAVAPANRIQVPIENDHASPEDMSAMWRAAFLATRPLLQPGAAYYVTGPQVGDLLLLLLLALRDSDFPLRHMLMWAKNQFVIGRSDYHYRHEPIIYGWIDGAAHHAVEDRGENSVWEIDKPRKSDLHPTMKPVELYARAYRNSSNRGDIALEPFAGSGTAFIAAEQLERRVAGSEISPAYCDVIVERWQNISGGKATRS